MKRFQELWARGRSEKGEKIYMHMKNQLGIKYIGIFNVESIVFFNNFIFNKYEIFKLFIVEKIQFESIESFKPSADIIAVIVRHFNSLKHNCNYYWENKISIVNSFQSDDMTGILTKAIEEFF